jgi:hypothetical protein
MVTLEAHIKVLREADLIDPTTSAACGYFLLVFKDHYVDKDNTHKSLFGKEGFVDPTGTRMTVEEFFKAITAPEPPEPRKRVFKPLRKWQKRAGNVTGNSNPTKAVSTAQSVKESESTHARP